MAQVNFTDREMQRAWKNNLKASEHSLCDKDNNAYRLLLFYAIECGLKAVLMKRRSATCTEELFSRAVTRANHNINNLLDDLTAGSSLKLPKQLKINSIRVQGKEVARSIDVEQINQVWRYGGCFIPPSSNSVSEIIKDDDLEKKLMRI
jgi:hypothetical protein